MAYTMIAERDNETVRKTRDSALIVLANARRLESDGWRVVISDDSGNSFDSTAFDNKLPRKLSSWLQYGKPAPDEFDVPFAMQRVGSELVIATDFAAETFEMNATPVHDDEAEFEAAEDDSDTPMAQAAE